MFQIHRLDCISRMFGFIGIKWIGTACLNIAECAGASADPTQNHEGGRAMLPALTDVGAGGLFTDSIELLAAHQLLYFTELFRVWRFHLQPCGLAHHRLRFTDRGGDGLYRDNLSAHRRSLSISYAKGSCLLLLSLRRRMSAFSYGFTMLTRTILGPRPRVACSHPNGILPFCQPPPIHGR